MLAIEITSYSDYSPGQNSHYQTPTVTTNRYDETPIPSINRTNFLKSWKRAPLLPWLCRETRVQFSPVVVNQNGYRSVCEKFSEWKWSSLTKMKLNTNEMEFQKSNFAVSTHMMCPIFNDFVKNLWFFSIKEDFDNKQSLNWSPYK